MRNFLKRITQTSMSEFRGILLVLLGLMAMGYYYSWWFFEGRLTSPLLILAFCIGLSYGVFQILGSWFLYLATHHRTQTIPSQKETITVDVFITACGEEQAMVEKSLAAATAMRGAHKTWLLDDKSDPVLARLARFYGAGYITRSNHKDAKAGNVNAALEQTDGDVVAIFDIDHIPNPEFLEHTVKYFSDQKIGFVQVMPTFSNGQESWVAQAAAETSLDFYNPTSKGMDGLKSVTKMGTNSLIRRAALNSIGGYQPGLAEDLATSLELHAAKWSSVYVAEPLAPGLVPPDLSAWFTQQLKWSRGVFELLLTAYPRLFKKLTWGQKISYAVRTTKYWIGFVIFLHLAIMIYVMLLGDTAARIGFERYLIGFFPLAFIEGLIRHLALRKWGGNSQKKYRHTPSAKRARYTPQGKAITLVYASWPIYSLAWFMAIARLPLSFKPTPKNASGLRLVWILPQIITTILLGIAIFITLNASGANSYPLTLLFASLQCIVHVSFLCRSANSISLPRAKTEILQYSSDVKS